MKPSHETGPRTIDIGKLNKAVADFERGDMQAIVKFAVDYNTEPPPMPVPRAIVRRPWWRFWRLT